MPENYERDLDLNLLRVFSVVAESGSVTAAAARLYLTQPAVSAALRRLRVAVGAPLFVRQGRGLLLTSRGERLLAQVQVHLPALLAAALAPQSFDPKSSERTVRLGLSDATEVWLLPRLLRELQSLAPKMRVIAVPVQFRNVAAALTSGSAELAITVADEMPAGIRRQNLFWSGFVCLYDPRHVRLKQKPSEREYLEQDHVIVSYNADLRGIIEDTLKKTRRARCSVSSFSNLGALIDGTSLVATVPEIVADGIRSLRPHLRVAELPFRLTGAPLELLWPATDDDDDASSFLRQRIAHIAQETAALLPAKGRRS